MKTQAIDWQAINFTGQKPVSTIKLNTDSALKVLLLVLAAVLPAALVSVITIWAISAGALAYVSAFYWAVGFIFLALVVETDGRLAGFLATSGLSLMALAWLSSRIAPEFGVLAGFLLAAWVALPVIKRLNLQNFSL